MGQTTNDKQLPCLRCGQLMRRTRWTFSASGLCREGWRCKPCDINLVTKMPGDEYADGDQKRDADTDLPAGGAGEAAPGVASTSVQGE